MDKHLFYLKKEVASRLHPQSINASGYYNEDDKSFVVIAGSSVGINRMRNKWSKDDLKYINECNAILLNDVVFSSPDAAAFQVVGYATSGLMEWKDTNGVPLHKYYNLTSKLKFHRSL